MNRPERTRKPNMRYDPSLYVLASFPKKNKHTIIPKHQVTIDAVNDQNGTLRSSGFIQPVRIIAEGTRVKCQEKATQFSRNTGSEEIEIQPVNNDEDKEVDDNHVYTNENFYNKDDDAYLLTTTDSIPSYNVNESALDFSLVGAYKPETSTRKRVLSEDEDDIEEDKLIDLTRRNLNKDNPKTQGDLSPVALIIDEHPSDHHDVQDKFTGIPPNVIRDVSDISERDDDYDEDAILSRTKPKKKKRKGTSRTIQSKPNAAAVTEFSNIQKEFLSFRYTVEKRLKSLEKTFRILKNRNILKERNDMINVNDSALPPKAQDPEIVLGVDVSKFNFAFDQHTKFVRQIFRQAGYASNPNTVLGDENMVMEIQNAIKKRDKRLQNDDQFFKDTWQIVKESVRQLKHDHRRNTAWKIIRAAQIIDTNSSQSQAGNVDIQSESNISHNDQNNIFDP